MSFFFFNDPATTEIYTLSLHDALPISAADSSRAAWAPPRARRAWCSLPKPSTTAARAGAASPPPGATSRARSEEHTSELQSRQYLVCRLLLEKKKKPHLYTVTLLASSI